MTGWTLAHAEVLDGSGAPAYPADVVVRGERIEGIAAPGTAQVGRVLDCRGLLLTPGFIDIHSHSDLTLLLDPRAASSVHQGVTLEVIGNCGHGCAPLKDIDVARTAIYGPIPERGFFRWSTMAGYLQALEEARPAVNVVALVPNGQLRLAHVGRAQRPASADELARMGRDLEEGLDAGAWGFSSGLEYVQEGAASGAEIDALCRIVARRGGLYATHTRHRDRRALEAIDEAVQTAARTGVALQISHITPRAGLPEAAAALERVDQARAAGLDIGFDMHTRLFGFTHLKNLLPLWALEGTPAQIRARLADPAQQQRIRAHPNLIAGVGDWRKVVLVDSQALAECNGLGFDEIARRLGTDGLGAGLAALAADVEQIERPMVLLLTYSEEMLRLTYQHPACMPGSDATALAPDGVLAGEKFHGAYTWAAWFLRRMVRETGALALPDAVHRLTGLPARRLGLADRGRIAPGMRADIALLDWAAYGDTGTVQAPSQLARGVRHLLVNGVATLLDGTPTGERAGQVLRAQGGR